MVPSRFYLTLLGKLDCVETMDVESDLAMGISRSECLERGWLSTDVQTVFSRLSPARNGKTLAASYSFIYKLFSSNILKHY